MHLVKKRSLLLYGRVLIPGVSKVLINTSFMFKYYDQQKAWMTGEVHDSYLTAFNSKNEGRAKVYVVVS